ncbi:MAG: alpha/beta hydrolase, partial [Phycisphaerales bacterium]|nr:alpha/beta hydrolase [Phycisphaerales bacterium]
SGHKTSEPDAATRELRHTHRVQSLHSTNPLPRMAWIEQRQFTLPHGEMTLQIYSPGGRDLPVIVLLPSIDFVSGDLVTHDRIARALAADTPALVVLPALPQQPEASPTTIHNAAWGTLQWLSTRVERWGGTSHCITLVAEGAGAATAIEVARRTRDEDDVNRIAGIVLPTPCFAPGTQPEHDELTDLPSVLILLGATDPNRQHGSILHDRLQMAKTETRMRVQNNQGPLRSDWALADPAMYDVVLETAREATLMFNACQARQALDTF